MKIPYDANLFDDENDTIEESFKHVEKFKNKKQPPKMKMTYHLV